MLIDDVRRRREFVHRMTVDFVTAVPVEHWYFSRVPHRAITRRRSTSPWQRLRAVLQIVASRLRSDVANRYGCRRGNVVCFPYRL